jgi:hypothetical protein
VDTLGSLGGSVRHRHANSALRKQSRRHPLVTSTQRNALSASLYAGDASCATLVFLCSGASCATWMKPDRGAACTTAGVQTGCSASYATFLLLHGAHRLSRPRPRTGHRGPSGSMCHLCPHTPLRSNGRMAHPPHRSRCGRCPIRHTSLTPRHSTRWEKRDQRRRRGRISRPLPGAPDVVCAYMDTGGHTP